jgi:hypothetical protein
MQLVGQGDGPVFDESLLAAHLEQVAGAGDELRMVDRAQQEIRRTRQKGFHPECPLVIDRQHDDGHIVASIERPQLADEFGARHAGHLEVGDDKVRIFGLTGL